MDNMNNQINTNGQGTTEEKTFTQEQLNAIVGKRLAEQKAALSAELDQRAENIARKELEFKAAAMLSDAGLPKELAGMLKYDNDKELIAAVAELNKIKGTKGECRILGPNKLPKSSGSYDESDTIKKAFGLQTERVNDGN